MSLNPEPSSHSEREAADLPPLSYADAVEFHEPDPVNNEVVEYPNYNNAQSNGITNNAQTNGNGITNGIHHTGKTVDAQLDAIYSKPQDAQNGYPNGNTNGNLSVNMNGDSWYPATTPKDDREQFVGEGLDSAPKSPIRGHRRVASRGSLRGAKKLGYEADSTDARNEETEAKNEGTDWVKGTVDKEGVPGLEIEKFVDAGGEHLTSVKKEDDGTAREDKIKKTELVSGRKAGAGWERSGIRWAPLNVPLKRRLQTIAVLWHTVSIAGMLTLFFFLCTIPLLWPLLIPYLIFCLLSNAHTSGELSYRSDWLRGLRIWSLFASYYPARLHRTQELPSTRKYIFGYHPHGIISHGAFAAFATEALGFSQLFPGITNSLLTLESNFRIPLYRDYALRLGLASVSRESCANLLSKGGRNGEGMGRAITIVIGGARESLEAQPGTLRLILNCRKGFIKMAIRHGADLVPVLAFGENDLYEQVVPEEHPWVFRVQMFIKKVMGFTIPLFHARGVFNYDVGMMPYRRPVNIVVGKPVLVERRENPESKYVDEVHRRYVRELRRVWEEWRDVFARDRSAELEIVE